MRELDPHLMLWRAADSLSANIPGSVEIAIAKPLSGFLCCNSPKRAGHLCELPPVQKPIVLAFLVSSKNGTGKPWLQHGGRGLQASRASWASMATLDGIPGCACEITRQGP